jgi:hypothetical protein
MQLEINKKGSQACIECVLKIDKLLSYRIPDRRNPSQESVIYMVLREVGERHHDNAGKSRELSAMTAENTILVKERMKTEYNLGIYDILR